MGYVPLKVVIVTTTFSKSRSELRHSLALRTIQEAVRYGYRIIVVDDSPDDVRQDYVDAGAEVHIQTESGMGGARRQVFVLGLATGAEVIIWLEPEKYPLVPLLKEAVEAVRNGTYDLVIPHRWDKGFFSLPPYQAISELLANKHIGEALGRMDLDYMFGPRIMSRQAAEVLLSYTGQAGGDRWQILFIPLVWLMKDRFKVGSVEVEYIHPVEQTVAEIGDEAMDRKRDTQRVELITGMQTEAKRLDLIPT